MILWHPSHPTPCADCQPLVTADFAAGERLWKHWMTPVVTDPRDARTLRFKVASKRAADGTFEFACASDLAGGTRKIWGLGYWKTEPQLLAFVEGIRSALIHLVGHPHVLFDMTDFSACTTPEQFERAIREGRTFDPWTMRDMAPEKKP
jgi:hypothetical protein